MCAVETECQRGILCPALVRVRVRHPSHAPDRGYSQFSAFARTAGRSCSAMGGGPGCSPRAPSGAVQGTSWQTSIHPLSTRERRIGTRAATVPETSGSSRSPQTPGRMSISVAAGQRRQIHGPQQTAVIAAGPAKVAADAARVIGLQGQAGEAGQAVSSAEGVHVPARGGDELGAEPGAHAGKAAYHLGVRMFAKPVLDESVEFRDLLIKGHHPLREADHHGGGQSFAGSAVCWAWAASTAVPASAAAPFTLRFFSQVSIRFAPVRRIAAGVW